MFGLKEDRTLAVLERIATALEVLARTTPLAEGQDESALFYTNDEDEVRRELRREAYYNATGIRLEETEDPPPHA